MDIKQKARSLRSNSTKAEAKLWRCLRNRELMGMKFRRQMPIEHYIADFVCEEFKLIIELDGGQHAEQLAYDNRRTNQLRSKGYQVVRYWNNDVLQNTEGVLQKIGMVIEEEMSKAVDK
jgi:very-short-patch-repair endonuclease